MTPTVLAISSFLSVTWGIYLIGTLVSYARIKSTERRRRSDRVVALRRFTVAFCIWLFCFSFAFRQVMLLLGVESDIIPSLIFFSLTGTNVVGSIFAMISLKYD